MNPKDLQPFLDVAISVLEAKDAIATAKLKDFLIASPGPAYIEQSLGLAVVHFANNNPPVFNWLLSNQNILSPELDLKSFTQKMIRQRLIGQGWTEGENFTLQSDQLLIEQASIAILSNYFSPGELSLIKALFDIDLLSQAP